MKRINLCLFSALLFLCVTAFAQKKPTKKPVQKAVVAKPAAEKKTDVLADEKKVRDIVAFLEYMLNTLGSSSTPIRDKDIVVTESYAKIFRDSKVQVEDDLDAERKVITNKDVIAYLKDVNFFFKEVRFEFTIEDIKSSTLPDGQNFYKVTTTRNLKGSTSENKPVNNTQSRYIEINFNPLDQDLKIVSIYTNEFDEKRALLTWWKELSPEWQSVFRKKFSLQDSVDLSELKTITALNELDISHNLVIQNLAPISQLPNLTSLNLAGTIINDLTPIRNLTELIQLDISNTSIKELSALKYSSKLKRLLMNHTDVSSLSVVDKMPALQHLEVSGSPILDFTPLARLSELQHINLSNTKLSDLKPLENLIHLTTLTISNTDVLNVGPLHNLTALHTLKFDSTRIGDITALSGLKSLKIVHADYSSISDLTSLQGLPHLERIYCDKTPIKQAEANAFMVANPSVLVIFDSEDMKVWWDMLPLDWQQILSTVTTLSKAPTKEELAQIPLLDSINLGESGITTFEPLRKLQKLKILVASKATSADLSPLQGLTQLTHLDISETSITDITVLSNLKQLKILKADGSKIENVDVLLLPGLEKFYADRTSVHDIIAKLFLEKNPSCLLIYKTAPLTNWWSNLSDTWKEVFTNQFGKNPGTTRENLHTLVAQRSLHIKDAPISDLSALREYIHLQELHFSGTNITAIAPIDNILSLKSLHATNSPIENIKSLSALTELEDLDVSNTPIEDVYDLWKLKKLTKLNCAGTQLRRLDALEKMENLSYLDCSNTNVSRLSSLDYLPLKTLKCYNTKIPNRIIENFKASHPECNVMYYR